MSSRSPRRSNSRGRSRSPLGDRDLKGRVVTLHSENGFGFVEVIKILRYTLTFNSLSYSMILATTTFSFILNTLLTVNIYNTFLMATKVERESIFFSCAC